MRQHPNQDPDPHEDEDLEALGTPLYQGTGLSVRALTAEELQRFLDAHAGQPAQRLGSGWAAATDPPPPDGTRLHEMRQSGLLPAEAEASGWGSPDPTAPAAEAKALVNGMAGTARPERLALGTAAEPAVPICGSLGPGRSALAQYRRRRSEELAAWTRSLVWRAPLAAAAGLTASALAAQAGLARTLATLAGLTVAALVGWRLRFKPSEQARAWQRGARGEQQTARLLDRLGRDGYVVFHDLAMPDSPANIDHLVLGPSGVFVIDSKQWTGSVHQSPDGLLWHNHYRLDRTLATIRWQAETLGRLLGIPAAPLLCVHGAHIQGGGLRAQGVAIVPATLLRLALGYDQVLSEVDVELHAATARLRLRRAT
jgi:hypothetical protein